MTRLASRAGPRGPEVAALLVLALAPAAACGDDPPAGGGPIPIEEAFGELSEARCEKRVRCGLSEDVETCKDYDADPRLLQLVTDAGTGVVTYDSGAARAYVEHVRAAGCELLESVAEAEQAAFRAVFTGTRKVDEACYLTEECAGTAVCDRPGCAPDASCCAGVCAAPPALATLGEDCSATACDATSWCETAMGGAMTCAAEIGNGLECVGQEACIDGDRCDLDPDTQVGKCYTLSKQGQPCNPDLVYGSCLGAGDFCHPEEKKCVLRPTIGDPCGVVPCRDFSVCDAMVCVARPRDGEACTDGGIPCRSGLDCSGGVCPPRPPRVACF